MPSHQHVLSPEKARREEALEEYDNYFLATTTKPSPQRPGHTPIEAESVNDERKDHDQPEGNLLYSREAATGGKKLRVLYLLSPI